MRKNLWEIEIYTNLKQTPKEELENRSGVELHELGEGLVIDGDTTTVTQLMTEIVPKEGQRMAEVWAKRTGQEISEIESQSIFSINPSNRRKIPSKRRGNVLRW